MINELLSALYLLVKEQAGAMRKGGTDADAGRRFEEATAQKVYVYAKDLGLRPNPPRHTLERPTLSGTQYQFDSSFMFGDTVYVVECKRRKMAAKEHICYFSSKILDYILGASLIGEPLSMWGIFLSTTDVGQNSMIYAIAYGIIVVAPSSPPLDHILLTLPKDSALFRAVAELRSKFSNLADVGLSLTKGSRIPPADLYREYKFLRLRWSQEQSSG